MGDLIWQVLRLRSQRGSRDHEDRLSGEASLLDNKGNSSEAERSFRSAIEAARRQSARLFELRATTSLARLLGQPPEAPAISNLFQFGGARKDPSGLHSNAYDARGHAGLRLSLMRLVAYLPANEIGRTVKWR